MDAKTLCLGVLTLGDASGYEIRKIFEDGPFAHFQDVGYGSIYPALAKLLEAGMVTLKGPADGGAAGRDGHPEKKVYGLTEAGQAAFRRALAAEPARDKVRSDAIFMMFFAELLDPDHLRRVYDDYLAFYRDRLAFLKGLEPTGVTDGRLFVRGLGVAFYEAVVAYMEENRARLLDADALPAASPARAPHPLQRAE